MFEPVTKSLPQEYHLAVVSSFSDFVVFACSCDSMEVHSQIQLLLEDYLFLLYRVYWGWFHLEGELRMLVCRGSVSLFLNLSAAAAAKNTQVFLEHEHFF